MLWFLLFILNVLAVAHMSPTYKKYSSKNCYTDHGGLNIDNSSTAPEGLTVAKCQMRCNNDKTCFCALFEPKIGKCWKRSICVPEQCDKDPNFDAYLKFPVNVTKKRNILYIVFDDLRPDLSFYGQALHTPNLQRLANTGTIFEMAYCQEAVCSPSRNSFTTGRRPNSTQVWNFINHFRQASCTTLNHIQINGISTEGGWDHGDVTKQNWGATRTGGFAQCCTTCSFQELCKGWTYQKGKCTLFSKINSYDSCTVDPEETLDTCVSGHSGAYPKWTTLPEHFKNNGYLALGAGKYFHGGCSSLGGKPGDIDHPSGPGTPPMADAALSWTNNAFQFPNQAEYVKKWGKYTNQFGINNRVYLAPIDNGLCRSDQTSNSSDYCNPDVPLDGSGAHEPLCDFITYNDVITKLQYAAMNREVTGQPFFIVAGIRRPHLNWRAPAGYTKFYPLANVSLPKQKTLDKSIDPIAYTVFPMDAPLVPDGPASKNFVKTPYVSGNDIQLKELRRHYYAAVSWADYVTGRILGELDDLQLSDDTMVVMHSDHGWHLGEYAMWEKRSNWELGTRVPLVIRVPWINNASQGLRSRALVELVDVYPTVCDIMGLSLPDDTVPFDGVSLKPVLESPGSTIVKDVALSTFPRCKHPGMPIYGARGAGGADNSCLDVERTDFTWMGYTMRTDRYRYTEWVKWNGTSLSPVWEQLHSRELYDHKGDDGPWTDPDNYENINLEKTSDPKLLRELSIKLHQSFGFP